VAEAKSTVAGAGERLSFFGIERSVARKQSQGEQVEMRQAPKGFTGKNAFDDSSRGKTSGKSENKLNTCEGGDNE
jgi:hypothetical protein